MSNSFFDGKKMPIGRLLLIFLMLLIVVVSGTFAWLTYASKRSALVLTIGDIKDTQIKLSPYQINETIGPGTSYTSGVYSNVEINKGNNSATSFSLFYKINSMDVVLIENGLSYTVINTMGTDSVDDDVTVKSGMFSDLIDISKGIPDKVVIMNSEENSSLLVNTITHYKVYLWLNSNVGNQNDVENSMLDVELNALIEIGFSDSLGNMLINNRMDIDTLSDNLTGGMYRYQGTDEEVINNYVCFGTSSKNTCIENSDTYMYRIIGIEPGGQTKVIKHTPLSTLYRWNTTSINISWNNSYIFNNLNDSIFLNNTTYVPDGWSDKIATIPWYYYDTLSVDYAEDAKKLTGENLYLYEIGMHPNYHDAVYTVDAKVGLMHKSDYWLSLGANNVCNSTTPCSDSWMNLSNYYDLSNLAETQRYEWTMDKYGYVVGAGYYAYRIDYMFNPGGLATTDYSEYTNPSPVRPVFNLTLDVILASGSGTETDPYIISDEKASGTYTINYYNGSELLDSEEHTIGVTAPLISWTDLGGGVGSYADYNWEFAGWNTSSDSYEKRYNDGQNVVNLSVVDGDEINLYAIYSRPVNFYTTVPGVDGGGTPSTVTIQYWNPFGSSTAEEVLSPVSLPLIPESNGWNAVGYSNLTTETYGDYGFGYFGSNNSQWQGHNYMDYDYAVDFYASYYKNYTINFNANGGTGTMNSVSGLMSHNLYYAKPTVESVIIPANGFTRPGYLFDRWVDSEGNEYNDGDDFEPSVDDYNTSLLEYTLNATWWDGVAPTGTLNVSSTDSSVTVSMSNIVEEGSGIDYYLFFMENDDDPSISYEHEDVNSNYTFMNVPAGTYTVTVIMIDNEGNESEYTEMVTINVSGEYHTVTVNYYNGTTFLDYSEHYTGQAQNLLSWDDDLGGDLGEYYDYHWEFAGWSTDPDSYVVEYTDAESVVNLTNVEGGEVDLYAVYSREVSFYYSATVVGSDIQYWNPYEFSTNAADGNLSLVVPPSGYTDATYSLDSGQDQYVFGVGEPLNVYPRRPASLYIIYN